jgi:toxin-antitoxin system PIN domain toxin
VILPDVNVLLIAHREELSGHERMAGWLTEIVNGDEAYGMSDLVLSGFLRVATNPRVFDPPTPLDSALEFVGAVRDRPNRVAVDPGPRHWRIFTRLCEEAGARADLVPDAYLAAMAIESGAEWVSTDRDFARFPGLRWRDPRQSS